ncbi:MAG: hypothetical protein GY815_19160 [Gammaproteobacteria bacterium]|nr:hypothetical protein [Gammaproteobacteria bacterium]
MPAGTLCALIRSCLKSMLLLLALCPAGLVAQNPLDAIAESLEREQMARLAAQQKRPGIHITVFRSDGCSGGMSQSWSVLADTLPLFTDYAGSEPPWEHCCVAHDRDYWRGETRDGFEEREQSDVRLRACVVETGEQRGADIAETLSLPQTEIVDMIKLTGELMYQAVRLGGGPCTGLSWRWGHGWPKCSASLEPGNQI